MSSPPYAVTPPTEHAVAHAGAAARGTVFADRAAAALLAGPALLTLVLVLHHPVLPPAPPGGRTMVDVAADLDRLAAASRWVHGGLLALLAAQTVAFHHFSARLGWHRMATTAGFLAYAAGALLLATPALLDGFVVATLAAECLRAAQTAGRTCGPADAAALRLVAAMIQVFSKAGLLLLSAAAGAWAVALLGGAAADVGGPGARRAAGLLGLACAAAPAFVLLGRDVLLQPGNLAMLLAAQSLWACAVAVLLLRPGAHLDTGLTATPSATGM